MKREKKEKLIGHLVKDGRWVAQGQDDFTRGREYRDWAYAYPDERNALLDVARTLIAPLITGPYKKTMPPAWLRSAKAFMKETEVRLAVVGAKFRDHV